jgi:hypothetical protein
MHRSHHCFALLFGFSLRCFFASFGCCLGIFFLSPYCSICRLYSLSGFRFFPFGLFLLPPFLFCLLPLLFLPCGPCLCLCLIFLFALLALLAS